MKTKILVIEDVPEMAELICMYLNNADFESLAFDTAEKALEKLSAGYSPALVILDLNLPGMSGFDFLKTFRKNYKATIPVIIVSARDADEDIIEGLGFGADEFVTKPFSPESSSCKSSVQARTALRNRSFRGRNNKFRSLHSLLQQLHPKKKN